MTATPPERQRRRAVTGSLLVSTSAVPFDDPVNDSVLGRWQRLDAAVLIGAIFRITTAEQPARGDEVKLPCRRSARAPRFI